MVTRAEGRRIWSVAAPTLIVLSGLACGRSLTQDGRPGSGGAGGSSTSPSNDAGDTASAGGSGAAGSGGVGGSSGNGGNQTPPIDAGNDRPPPLPDASLDVGDARIPDLAPDRSSTPDVGGCPADCTQLPHVRAGAYAPCVNGACNLNFGACEDGFTHCGTVPNIGCETDLSSPSSCGGCTIQCPAGDECRGSGSSFYCLQPCQPPTPDACGIFSCVDVQSDVTNCGTCDNSCFVPNTRYDCQQGKCVTLGCNDSTVADCTSDPGCETTLGDPVNCGGCNDPACTLANTMYTCSDGLGCNASVCDIGYANCDTTSADCETAFTSPGGASCLPQYVGSVGLATQVLDVTLSAVAPDGSFFIAGTYANTVDFDPSAAGKDIRTATDTDGFITKFNADGGYAWTATLGGRGVPTLTALAATSSGGAVAAGSYQDTIDLDPGPASDIHVTTDGTQNDAYVVELGANGTEVWGRTLPGVVSYSNATSTGVALDAAGAVYLSGNYGGTVDFSLGAGNDARSSQADGSGFLVKLTSGGSRAWAQTLDDTNCTSVLNAVAITTDGSAWSTGSLAPGPDCTLAPAQPSPFNTVLILKVNAAGNSRTTWLLADDQLAAGSAIAAGRDGAVYLGGLAMNDFDTDPGPGMARRWFGTYAPSAFVTKLAADGTYQWSRVLNSSRIVEMASAPDGGVVAAAISTQGFVTRLTASGDSVWTLPVGDSSVSVTSIGSNATSFAVAGTSSGTQDFDPGPGLDLIFGDIAFVSRFNF